MGENRSTAIVVADLAIMTVLALWVLAENDTAAVVYKAFFWATVPLAAAVLLIAPQHLCASARIFGWYGHIKRAATAALLAVAHETAMLSVYIALLIVMGALYGRCSAHSCKEPS